MTHDANVTDLERKAQMRERAQRYIEQRPNYSPFNRDIYSLDLDRVELLMADFAESILLADRQETLKRLRERGPGTPEAFIADELAFRWDIKLKE